MASSNTHPSTSFDVNMLNSESVVFNAKLLKPLDEALRCHICFDYFTNCMTTRCSHNYCSVCIRRYMNYKAQCPTCFQVATEPELQNNRLIDEVVRIYKKIRETLQIPCDSISKTFHDPSSKSKTVINKNSEKPVNSAVPVHNESKRQNTEISTTDEVYCPVCYKTVLNSRINIHLDTCLKQSDERNERKFLPKLVYHLLSDKEIRKKLKDHGLHTTGTRQALIRRHKNFITLYNANCDSLNPKPVPDLLLEIECQELEERLNDNQAGIQINKKSEPSLIKKERESYLQEHKSQFNALIQEVQERVLLQEKNHLRDEPGFAGGKTLIKEEPNFTAGTSNITDISGNVIGESILQIGNASNSDPVIVKEEFSESLLDGAVIDNVETKDNNFIQEALDTDYVNPSHLSFRIKKELPSVKMKEDSPSLLDMTTNQSLAIDSSSLESFETSKMQINKYHKKKYARRLSTEEKNTQRKK